MLESILFKEKKPNIIWVEIINVLFFFYKILW